MSRYRIISSDAARERGYPDAPEEGWRGECWCLYRFDATGNAVELIGTDGGEPEDQVLVRDWAWVAEALNREAERVHAAARDAREAALREAEAVCRERAEAFDRIAGRLAAPDSYSATALASEARYCARAIAALAGREEPWA
jgi:hypothetical protein